MVTNEKNEDLDICRECGGKCCKKSGCDYGAGDIRDRSYRGLLRELAKGDKSIVAAITFHKLDDGELATDIFLYLRARNVNRDVVDLVSMKTQCSMLTEVGCSYEYDNRPLGGRNLTPIGEGGCRPVLSPEYIVKTWAPYQKSLRKIVKKYTGKSVETKVSEDVENLFYELLMGNVDGVSDAEKYDLSAFVPMLAQAFPYELARADIRSRGIDIKTFSKKKFT